MLAKDNPEGQQTTLLHTCPRRRATSPLPHLFFLVPGAALTLGREGLGEPGGGSLAGGPRAPARSLTWAPASRGRAVPLPCAGSPRRGGSCAARLARKVRAGPTAASPRGGRRLWVDYSQARPAAALSQPPRRQRSSETRPQGLARRHRGSAPAAALQTPEPAGHPAR